MFGMERLDEHTRGEEEGERKEEEVRRRGREPSKVALVGTWGGLCVRHGGSRGDRGGVGWAGGSARGSRPPDAPDWREGGWISWMFRVGATARGRRWLVWVLTGWQALRPCTVVRSWCSWCAVRGVGGRWKEKTPFAPSVG